ncbi:DUF4328 domain-containing protein [Jiangella asiatica]|uniref:DUF4328 domain-containing protein n=1 Tax=Jiangella asiatica TaxID=2530372 RepID=A0A4R5DC10_9ACTN|nr:DUF4328 domain-containing protein [Jiangella asiatica]TDE09124.1 DUF4328 domain-containing protein [Jiangella asiatica]
MSFYDNPDHQWDRADLRPAPRAGDPASLGGLRTALTVLLAIIAAISAVTVVAYLLRIAYVVDVLDDGGADPDRADALDAFMAACVVLWTLMLLAIAPVFIVWQYRHAKNARLLGSVMWGPGWAVGGWFIPIANLFIPARQVYVSSRFSDPRGRAAGVVVGWWLCLVLASTLNRAVSTYEPEGLGYDYLRGLRTADSLGVAAEMAFIAASVLAVVMVRRLSDRQDEALRQRLARLGGPTAPSYAAWPMPPGAEATPYGPPPGAVPAPPPVPPAPSDPPH